MKFWNFVMNLFARQKANLLSLDNQPLGRASLVVLVFLDLFVFVSIFEGLDTHSKQFPTPEDVIPLSCREIVIDKTWNATNRTEKLANFVMDYQSINFGSEGELPKEHHPICQPFQDSFEEAKGEKSLTKLFRERNTLSYEQNDIQRDLLSLKDVYDTSLLETIAGQEEGKANVQEIQKNIRESTEKLNNTKAKITTIESKIQSYGLVQKFWKQIDSVTDKDREELQKEYKSLLFWQPTKNLGIQLLFLAPIFLVFYLWNRMSIKGNRNLQILVSSHLLLVSSIPLFFVILETIYNIIPKVLLKKLLEFLLVLKLVALWNYLILVLMVLASLFLIYLFQKKFLSQQKTYERRIQKNQCQACGKGLSPGSSYCSFCGFSQFVPCAKCKHPRYVYAKYCQSCGVEQTRKV